MTIQDLGSLGELVAAIATVATLGYLAVQIRQNTRAVRSTSFQALSDTHSDRVMRLAENADLHQVYRRGLRGEDLTESDQQRFGTIMISLIRLSSNAFVQYRAGLLTEDQWQGFRHMPVTLLSSPGGSVWWERGRTIFGEEFAMYIDDELRIRQEQVVRGAPADDRVPRL